MPPESTDFQPGNLPALNAQTALFLDFDGTLVEIAPEPDLVQVPADLASLLGRLHQQLDGALAIVSGRKLDDIDRFLAPLQLPVFAEHGAVMRLAGASVVHTAAPELQDIKKVALALAAEHEGLLVEVKSAALSLHYRGAPQLESVCLEAMAEVVKRTPGFDLMQGKFVFDVKPSGVNKGTAIETLMMHAPFAGRNAIFAGDDTTDEAGLLAVQAVGGQGIKVGPGASAARFRCSSPAQLRDWLRAAGEGPNR